MTRQWYRSRANPDASPPASLAGAGEPLADVGVAYPVEIVPAKAADAVAWIGAAVDDRDRRARAEVVAEVESQRPHPRKAVTEATVSILGF